MYNVTVSRLLNIVGPEQNQTTLYNVLAEKASISMCINKIIQSNLNGSNTDGSFTMANSNSFPLDQENKYLGKFSYFIVKMYVVCTH